MKDTTTTTTTTTAADPVTEYGGRPYTATQEYGRDARRRIERYMAEYPRADYRQIAEAVGSSTQYVGRIAKKTGSTRKTNVTPDSRYGVENVLDLCALVRAGNSLSEAARKAGIGYSIAHRIVAGDPPKGVIRHPKTKGVVLRLRRDIASGKVERKIYVADRGPASWLEF